VSLVWIRSSQRPHVSLTSPWGDFRTGTTSRFVGNGIGPAIATPVRSLISLICWHTLSTFFGSVPLSEIRAFWAMRQPGETDLAGVRSLRLLDVADLARRDGLAHVPDREATHLGELLEGLDHEGLRRADLDAGRVAGLEEVGLLGLRRARLRVQGRDDLLEGACDLGRVGVEDRRVPGRDDARMIEDDDLRREGLGHRRRAVRGAHDVPATDVLLVDPSDVEPGVVARLRLRDLLVVHLDRLDFADLVRGHEVDLHADLQDAGLDPSDRDRPGARDRVDVLDREAEGQVRRLWRHLQVVERLDEVRALVPGHLLRRLRDVLALVRADRDERDLVHLVANAPEQRGEFRLQLVEARLRERRLRRVHLVDRDDQLLDAERAREEDVFFRLRLHAFRAANDEHGRIRLGRAGNHVLDEVPVAWGVDDREVVLVRVKALVRDVDRQAALPLLLHLVHDEGELERGLAHLLGEFLQVLEFVGVDVPRVVQDPADGRRLPVVDVADEHQVEVGLRGHVLYSVTRTLTSSRIYLFPVRRTRFFSERISMEPRASRGNGSVLAETKSRRLEDVLVRSRDLRFACVTHVDEGQLPPCHGSVDLVCQPFAMKQELEVPMLRGVRKTPRRVGLRHPLRLRRREA